VHLPGTAALDTSAWPLVVFECPPHLEDSTVGRLIEEFEAIHARKSHFALLIDTRRVQAMPSARWRRGITEWANDRRVWIDTHRYGVGTALFIASPLARGVYTALLWFWKPPNAHFVAPSMMAAVDWCCQRLTQAGVALSADLLTRRASIEADALAATRGEMRG
jgi:hypothetical protein